ncbi:YeeE/YedE family protein [Streptomyces sp. NRRL S-481]|uniref:YeeE/YedE family protein n=1 Tax=Streptomyces sp. NRRL S-481 TaxID=1463911 RepID=UPI0004CA242E|nr:YeeE/YedE thiosulfate transporter family protein [Streptomyces sp. NRRL S-481]
MSTYWPWWAGAVGLALVTINHTLVTDRSLGVSAAWDRVLHWRRERRLERMDDEFADDQALAEALAAATAEHFGTTATATASTATATSTVPQVPYGTSQPLEADAGADADTATTERPAATSLRPAPLITQAVLLVSIFLGGLIAAVTSGRFHLRFDMGPAFRNLVTADSAIMIAVLFVGGVLVGFGTRLAGGCSSGHGLSGCGRLRPVSIVATAVFFGTAVAVSFLLWKVI